MDYKTLIEKLPKSTASLITLLHNIAHENGCGCRVDETDNNVTLVYSARNFKININNGAVSFSGEFDPRAFYKLYSETVYDKVNELLFGAVEACSLCINDKCTTFLMADKGQSNGTAIRKSSADLTGIILILTSRTIILTSAKPL